MAADSDSSSDRQAKQPGDPGVSSHDTRWEKDLVNRLAFAAITEQRRARRWGIFFKTLFFLYLVVLLYVYRPSDWGAATISTSKHTALVEMRGIITDEGDAGADNVIEGLQAAFKDKKTAGVILRINSPGGSPVQAGYINDEIMRLREKYTETPIYAVLADICASGGYYVAVAAKGIYANKASIVGSIGVRMDSFGFVDAINKLGIERRLMTAGEHKGFLDPFLPENPTDVQHVQQLLDQIHAQFIQVVRQGRQKHLKDDPELFSGLVWTGQQAVELGLVDGLGDANYVARELIGAEDIVDFTPEQDLLDRLSKGLGAAAAKVLVNLSGETHSLR
jgi:protease-4